MRRFGKWGHYVPWLLAGLCLAFAAPRHASAQALSAITGVVTDPSGAVIVGAHITVTNTATGIVSKGNTSGGGNYNVSSLIPGNYTVEVDAKGFKKSVQNGVNVEVGVTATVNVMMSTGSAAETVEVSASAISLDTTSPQLGTTLEPEVLNKLPIEIASRGRQIDAFVFLTPGVQGSSFSKNVNGGVNFESEVVFNGIPVPQPETQGYQTNFNPPYEMVNEFRVERSVYSAQYGLAQGAVTYSMASGTNTLHGDIFEINRNSLFDSNGFFDTYRNIRGDLAPPVDKENNYGFTVGGPVFLPKLYDGRNRTFFHVSAEWFKQSLAQTSIGTVPTVAERAGDFSHFVDASGTVIPIYDPLTGQQFQYNGQLNVIPPSRISPLSASLLPLLPNPDLAGTNFGLLNNKSPAVPSLPIIQHNWGFTVDHNLTATQSLHYSEWRNTVSAPSFDQPAIVPSTNPLQSLKTQPYLGSGFLLNYSNALTPNLVMTAGIGWIGEINNQFNALTGTSFAGVQNSTVFPEIAFDGQNAPTQWGTDGSWESSINRKLGVAIVNNWIWTKGRHTFNIGGEFRRAYQDDNECQTCGGRFQFSQKQTSIQNPNDPNFGSYGSSFASFLLGTVDSANRQFANELRLRNFDLSPYIQDDFKMTPKLTVNLGLRWDIMVPFTENNNQIVFLNPTEANPSAGGLPGAATKLGSCTGCAGYNRAAIHWGHFDPRVGFAYMVNNKTVVQAGFTISFLDGGAYEYGTSKVAVSYGNLLLGTFSRNSTNSYTSGYGNWDTNQMPAPPAQAFNSALGIGNTIHYFANNLGLAPYNEGWNVNVQRELPWNMYLQLAYIGNRDIHLPSTLNPQDQLNPANLKYGSLLSDPVNSPAAVAAGITSPYPNFINDFGSGATVGQSLKPFPQYTSVFNNFDMAGTTFYNAFQGQVEKRFTNGLAFLTNITLGRNLSNVDSGFSTFAYNSLNKYNQRAEWAVSSLDQKYSTKTSATYELPIGPGKRFLNNKGVTGQLLGGFQVSMILDYEGGGPLNPIIQNGDPLLNADQYQSGFDRPNIVPGVKRKTYSYADAKAQFTGKAAAKPVFSTNAFQTVNVYTLGNASRNYASLRGAPYRLESFDATKEFSITERIKASLRVDYFNAFNRVMLNNPDINASDSTFGQITNSGYNGNQSPPNRQGQATFRVEF